MLARLAAHGNDAKKAFGDLANKPLNHVDGETPITSVRVVTRMNPATVHAMKDRDGKEFKHLKYGNNHHVEIIEHVETGKRKGVFVTAMEAARRARIAKVPVVQKDGPWKVGVEELHDGWKFVIALSTNDIVELDNKPWRVQMLSGGEQFVIGLKGQYDSLAEYNQFSKWLKSEKSTSSITGKFSVTALGKLIPNND